MGTKRQRQDVAFLALAIAVLAVSVALFVGIRMLPKGEKKPSESAPATEPEAALLTDVPAPAETGRDPFGSQQAAKGPSGRRTTTVAAQDLKLIGIVQGRQPLAVIRRDSRRYYVRLGDSVRGRRVTAIGEDRVILARGDEQVILMLRQPLEEDEEQEWEAG